jgi:hypothetical protein
LNKSSSGQAIGDQIKLAPTSTGCRKIAAGCFACVGRSSASRGGSLPHKSEESVIKSSDPGDTEYQGDSKGRLRSDAIENASEVEHDTGSLSSLFRDNLVTVRPIHFDGHHILTVRP